MLGFPRLAGLPAAYLQQQMREFANGRRASPIMMPIARALSPRQIEALATLYASRAGRSSGTGTLAGPGSDADARSGAGHSATFALGERLANRGRWNDDVPACVQCHGMGGSGVGSHFPALVGQPAAYLQGQLRAWQNGSRDPGPMGLMGAIARKLSDADVAAVADYFGTGAPAVPDLQAIARSRPIPAGLPAQAGATQPAARTFNPPPDAAMPAGEMGQTVRLGEQIFDNTTQYAPGYVGNRLRCSSCHLDAGRKANSAPLWAAYVAYPAYRSKNHHVNTFAERLQGCFVYSMNGKAPPLGDPILVALESYSYWLATGAPIDPNLPGRGYPKPARPHLPANFKRGQQVFIQHCALCHGADGAGQNAEDGSMAFPALWGDGSFNWGAGMAGIGNAAAFIQANMPLSQGGTLNDQQAWDVATYMDSHERPQDPRFLGSVQATRAKFHDSVDSMYGRRVNGHLLGGGSVPVH